MSESIAAHAVVVGVSLSPRKQSNSSRLLEVVLCDLSHSLTSEVHFYDLAETKIDCTGCEDCYASVDVHGDGIAEIIKKLLLADLIVFSCPTNYGMPPALGKALMDRTDSLWREQEVEGKERLRGKLGAIIVNGATEPKEHPSVGICVDNIRHFFKQHKMELVPTVACVGGTAVFDDGRYPDELLEEILTPLKEISEDIKRCLAERA